MRIMLCGITAILSFDAVSIMNHDLTSAIMATAIIVFMTATALVSNIKMPTNEQEVS